MVVSVVVVGTAIKRKTASPLRNGTPTKPPKEKKEKVEMRDPTKPFSAAEKAAAAAAAAASPERAREQHGRSPLAVRVQL